MDNEKLKRANKLEKEIRELELFIGSAAKVWTGKIIKKECKYIFKSSAYGFIDSQEYDMDNRAKNKVLEVLREHLEELRKEFENL